MQDGTTGEITGVVLTNCYYYASLSTGALCAQATLGINTRSSRGEMNKRCMYPPAMQENEGKYRMIYKGDGIDK